MKQLFKRYFKRHSHNLFFKALAGLGRSFNRFYENRNHDMHSNGELQLLKTISTTNPKIIFDCGANRGNYGINAMKILLIVYNKNINACR